MKTKVKKLLSLLLVFVLVMGTLPMTALAEEVTVPEGWYKVTVKVAPSDATVKFYSDSDAKTEITENVYDNEIVDGYHQYTLVAPEGTYSYRAWEDEQYLGGMEFKVPIADEYASDGTLMGKGQVLTLKRVNFVTTHEAITKVDDYTLHLYPQDMNETVIGTNYVNESGNVVAPVMVNAAGNATTYQGMIDINGELGSTYAVKPLENLTFSVGNTAETRNFNVEEISFYTITAPAEAKVQMFRQNNNYNVVEVLEKKNEILDDGRIVHYFAIPGGQAYTYRVSMKDKITRAGYVEEEKKNIEITFEEKENPKSTRTTASRIENSSVININAQNNLKLAIGDVFRLRSFRAGWQIINTDPGNIMIEPDFHYNIVSGAEHIHMSPVTDTTTGNAGSGENSNWMDIEALSTGTVVIEVSYDGIQIDGNTGYPGIYGAVDSSRKSVVVINIGEIKEENTLEITPVHGDYTKYVWDADFDTVYFLDETADFNFTAKMENSTPDKVELSTDLGKSYTTVNKTGSTYNAKGLIHGNNILRVTKGNKVEYQIVRASRLKVSVVNMTRNSDALIAGDDIRVVFSGIYTPVPKMSGIYNPGWTDVHRTNYTVPSGVAASSTSTQYGFAADNKYNLKFEEAGTYTFTDGYINSSVMGDETGAHRLLTDAGRGVNMNARNNDTNRAILPDLTFEVMDMPEISVTVKSSPSGADILIQDEAGNAIEAQNGVYTLEYGTYSYKLEMDGYVPERGKFTVGGDDYITKKKTVTISMRKIGGAIWDGKTTTEPQTNEYGTYLIGTGSELAWYAKNHNGASAILTADISVGGFGIQIKDLKGTFDGYGHYIMDLYGDSLFKIPQSGAVIQNLGVSGEVNGQGGIVTSNIAGGASYTIQNCVSRISVTGKDYVGGIVGALNESSPTIKNCYNAGTVNGSGYGYTGGIAGFRSSVPIYNILNCYNIGKTTNFGVAKSGGRGTNRNNYTLLGAAPNPGGTELGADVLKTYAGYLGDAYMDNPTSYNDGYPILTWEEPRALEAAKADYPAELEAYKANESYDEAGAAMRTQAVEEGQAAIEAAATLGDAKTALDQAKAVIDAIETGENPDSGEEEKVLLGDVNGDGSINGKDSIVLLQYLTGNTHETFNETNADFNGDGEVNGKDSILLLQHLTTIV